MGYPVVKFSILVKKTVYIFWAIMYAACITLANIDCTNYCVGVGGGGGGGGGVRGRLNNSLYD